MTQGSQPMTTPTPPDPHTLDIDRQTLNLDRFFAHLNHLADRLEQLVAAHAPQPAAPNPWLDTDQLAAHLNVPPATVRYWRHTGTGPPAHKLGRRVRYHTTDIATWQQQHRTP